MGETIGRERELEAIDRFLRSGSGALVLSGPAGIGKTTLWQAGVALAGASGHRVLTARPGAAETRLSFTALGDLLERVEPVALDGVPEPQREALEVALLRAAPGRTPPEPRAVALGVLGTLRALAASGPLVIAIDDVQWLDSASADALAFAVRRLDGHAVRFLLTRRARTRSALEPAGHERLRVGPLSLGATRRLLWQRLGVVLPKPVLRRAFEAAHGNPLFALELGRTLAQRGAPAIGEELALPDAIDELLGVRIASLPGDQRRFIVAIAIGGELRHAEAEAVVRPATIEAALEAGLVVLDRDRVRLAHPLLGAAALGATHSEQRRELHRALARAVGDEERRARHLALGTQRPDAKLAATVAAAAPRAAARGAADDAVELAEQALRLTPAASAQRSERLLALAERLVVAGDDQRVTELLAPQVDALPAGSARVRAHLLLADGAAIETIDDHARELALALAAAGDDPLLRAPALARLAEQAALGSVERVAEAEGWALEALPAAQRGDPELEQLVLSALGWARILRGRPIDDLAERSRAGAGHLYRSLERPAAVRLAWRGEIQPARSALTRLVELAEARGEAFSCVALRTNLCEVELRAGRWAAAEQALDGWGDSSDASIVLGPVYERCRALLAAGRGEAPEAERWAADAIAAARAAGVRWEELEALRARGIGAAHHPQVAADSLEPVWEHTQREGIEDPGAFPVAAELVEAQVTLGDTEAAQAVTDRLAELAQRHSHPWGLVTERRCRALVRLAQRRDEDAALAALEGAARDYAGLGLGFDVARSYLSLGRAQRRLRRRADARRSLERAARGFDELGSAGWASVARDELRRIAGRRPRAAGELTATERRVAELAADGLANKEIARALFVTVHTVEAHLTRVYAQLGIRSRGQLARRLSGRSASLPES